MSVVIIVLVAVVAIVVIAGLALSPLLNKKGDAAVARAKEIVGESRVKAIEPKAVGMGTEPSEAGGLLGLGCLVASDDKVAFVTWQPIDEFTIDRSKVGKVEAAADDPAAVQKTTIEITYTADNGEDAIARWRLGGDLVEWLNVLGYDWGPEGPPMTESPDSGASGSPDAPDSSDG
ncbi:MAG: hypothetical protein HYX32_08140 [Actinobacteria bacterium]|nr:hypothetical protein [Actinomycetota bacterium]